MGHRARSPARGDPCGDHCTSGVQRFPAGRIRPRRKGLLGAGPFSTPSGASRRWPFAGSRTCCPTVRNKRSTSPVLENLLRHEAEKAIAEIVRRGGPAAALEARLRKLAAGDVAGPARLFGDAALVRRELRLQRLRQTTPQIVFVKRHDIRPSFIAYTEALSDARHERNFTPGSSLCLLDLSGQRARGPRAPGRPLRAWSAIRT